MYWEEGKPPHDSQAAWSLALAKLNEIFHLQGAKTPSLRVKIYEQHMSEIVGKEKADITGGSKILI